MVQCQPKSHMDGPAHAHYATFAVAAGHRGHTADVVQRLVIPPAYVKPFIKRQKNGVVIFPRFDGHL